MKTYRIQAGDRLSGIAALHGIDAADIVALNPHKVATRTGAGAVVFAELAVGEEIQIPPTEDEVRAAKSFLRDKLVGQPWFRGIGIGGGWGTRWIVVNVNEINDQVLAAVPPRFVDVRVELHEIGDMAALAGPVPGGSTAPTSEREARAKQAGQAAAAGAATAACVELGPAAVGCGVAAHYLSGELWDRGHWAVNQGVKGVKKIWASITDTGPDCSRGCCEGPDCTMPPPEPLLARARAMGVHEAKITAAMTRVEAGIAADTQAAVDEAERIAQLWRGTSYYPPGGYTPGAPLVTQGEHEDSVRAWRASVGLAPQPTAGEQARAFMSSYYDRANEQMLAATPRRLEQTKALLRLIADKGAEDAYFQETGIHAEMQPDGTLKQLPAQRLHVDPGLFRSDPSALDSSQAAAWGAAKVFAATFVVGAVAAVGAQALARR